MKALTVSKLRNKKVTIAIDGEKVTFDSQAEHARYCHLVLLQRAKLISNLQLQPKFELAESFSRNGKTHRATSYIADFIYTTKEQKTVVEDVKGMKTDVYQLKKKLFLAKYGSDIKLIEVMYARKRFTEKEV